MACILHRSTQVPEKSAGTYPCNCIANAVVFLTISNFYLSVLTEPEICTRTWQPVQFMIVNC